MVKQTLKLIFAGIVSFAIISWIAFFIRMNQVGNSSEAQVRTIIVGQHELTVEIADTPFRREKGLSNRSSLDQNQGMLFVFDDYDIRDFWMKDMMFPLDVIWIKDGIIAGMQENIPFEEDEAGVVRFASKQAVNMVLELNAGWIAKNSLKTGDRVDVIEK